MNPPNESSSTAFFYELQALLLLLQRQTNSRNVQTASAFGASPVCRQWLESPVVMQELEKWWVAAPPVLHVSKQQSKEAFDPTMTDQYRYFYQQLAHGVTLLSRIHAPTGEELSRAMAADFHNDTCMPSTLSDELRFKRSIAVLALSTRDNEDRPQSAESLASCLHELYETTFSTGSPNAAAVKLSLQPKTKQRSLSNNEPSLTRSTTTSVRKSSTLDKVNEDIKLQPETYASSSVSRVTRSASAVLPLSNSLAALESLRKRKKSILIKQRTASRLSVSQSIAEPMDEIQASSESQATSDSPALRGVEKQSSISKMRQSTKTKIMAGTDPNSSLSKRLSDARLARMSSNLSRMDSDLSLRTGRGGLEHQLSSLSLYDATNSGSDNSSHFFSIETRLELKERLIELQKQLSDLLVRTKLAWMKCFAENSLRDSSAQQHVASRGGLVAASELVVKGEHLMMTLHSAFSKATSTTNCPIKEYQDLIESVEIDFRDFQELVRSIAQQSFPSAPPATTQLAPSQQHNEQRAASESPTKSAPAHPFSYDLPSMKSYCAKVAPPYSSYLTNKK